MPDHGGKTGRDTLGAVLARLDKAEQDIHDLKGGRRMSMDRGDTGSLTVDKGAFEGQTLIQYDTEGAHYFSNGVWRSFGSGLYATSPQVIPILFGEGTSYDGFSWGTVAADPDSIVPGGWVRTNGGTQNSYLTTYVTLGPKGSHWGLVGGYKQKADAGIITASLASVTETSGVLSDTAPGSYVDFTAVDAYSASTSFVSDLMGHFIIDGEDATVLTSFTTDGNGDKHMDGGSGIYSLRLKVSTKNASSSSYHADLYGLAFMRLNEIVEFTGGF